MKCSSRSLVAEPDEYSRKNAQTSLAVAVVMERTPLENNRWESEKW
jgi:hypothetical protein